MGHCLYLLAENIEFLSTNPQMKMELRNIDFFLRFVFFVIKITTSCQSVKKCKQLHFIHANTFVCMCVSLRRSLNLIRSV